MPTFFLNGNLVHFAGYAKHIGFYPTGGAIDAFASELARLFKHDTPAVLEVLVVVNAMCRARKQALELRLPIDEREAPALVSVQFQ